MDNKNKTMIKDTMVIECSGTKDQNYAYDIKEQGEPGNLVIELLRSEDTSWVAELRGEPILKLKDDGNGVIMNGETFPYHEVYELKVLLDYYFNQQGDRFCKTKFCQEIQYI